MFCENCGNSLPDGARFCGECGVPVSQAPAEEAAQEAAAVIAEEVIPAAEAVREAAAAPVVIPEAPAEQTAPKKSHAGLIIGIIAAAVIVLGVLIAGLFTNWFRAEKPKGPMDEIMAAYKAAFPEGSSNGTATIRTKISGISVDIPVQFDMDHENPENSAVYADINIFGNKLVYGMYQGKMIISTGDFVQVKDLGSNVLPGAGTSGMKKDGKYDTESYFRETMDEDEFDDLAAELDFDKLNEAMQALENNFNDEAWLTEFCGYSREEAEDTVTYHLNASPELFDEVKRIISPAYRNQDFGDKLFEQAMEGIGDILPLDRMSYDVVSVNGKLDHAVVTLELGDSPIEMDISFSEIGKTEVDRDALQELLDSESEFDW